MGASESPAQRFGRFVLTHEQRLKLLYVGAALAMFALIGADRAGVRWADRLLAAHEARWVTRLESGEALVAAGRFEEAAEFLAQLDAEFPARHIKHALGRERERVLVALGKALQGAGRQRKARETFERLAAFDPRNFADHFEQAQCLLAQGRTKVALANAGLESLGRCLAIDPSYLPAVTKRIEVAFGLYRFRDVANAYREYQEAFLLSEIDAEFDGAKVACRVPADGRYHDVDFRAPSGPAKSVRVRCAEQAVAVYGGRAWRPQTAGESSAGGSSREIAPGAWKADGVATVRPNTYAPATDAGWLVLDPNSTGAGIVRLVLRMRVLRPIDRETLDRVSVSLRNLRDADQFGIDFDRLVVAAAK